MGGVYGLSRLTHPSRPRLVGHGDWQNPGGMIHPFVAMEWVEGSPLYDEAARLPPASSQQVLRWLAQLARALADLHAQGGIHRDVKGANILVRRADAARCSPTSAQASTSAQTPSRLRWCTRARRPTARPNRGERGQARDRTGRFGSLPSKITCLHDEGH